MRIFWKKSEAIIYLAIITGLLKLLKNLSCFGNCWRLTYKNQKLKEEKF